MIHVRRYTLYRMALFRLPYIISFAGPIRRIASDSKDVRSSRARSRVESSRVRTSRRRT
jgi:hypothetical protein